MGSSRQIVGVPARGLLVFVHQLGHSLVGLLQIGIDTPAHDAHGLFAIARQGSTAHRTSVGCSSIKQVRCRLDFFCETRVMLHCISKQCPVVGLHSVQFP